MLLTRGDEAFGQSPEPLCREEGALPLLGDVVRSAEGPKTAVLGAYGVYGRLAAWLASVGYVARTLDSRGLISGGGEAPREARLDGVPPTIRAGS